MTTVSLVRFNSLLVQLIEPMPNLHYLWLQIRSLRDKEEHRVNRMSIRSHAPPIANEIPPRRLDGAKIRFINFLHTQPGPSPPVQEFQPEDQIQNNNANTRKPWWEKIPGASTLFRQPSSNAIPPEFEKSSLCNEPGSSHNVPVCSVETPLITHFGSNTLGHCRFCTITFLLLLISLQQSLVKKIADS